MTQSNDWHLSKSVTVGLIVSVAGMVIGGTVAWANTIRDINDNTENIEKLVPKVTAIYEGLLVRGLIEQIK